MEIKIDYYLKQDKLTRLMHTTITEDDIINILKQKFQEGDLACPINFNRDQVEVRFEIDKVIV
jgi:hypothetical protein